MTTKNHDEEGGESWQSFAKTALIGTVQTLAESTFRNVAETVENFTSNVVQTVSEKVDEVAKRMAQKVGAGALALVGGALLLSGFASYLSAMWGKPGTGEMAIGAVALIVAVGLFVFWSKSR